MPVTWLKRGVKLSLDIIFKISINVEGYIVDFRKMILHLQNIVQHQFTKLVNWCYLVV